MNKEKQRFWLSVHDRSANRTVGDVADHRPGSEAPIVNIGKASRASGVSEKSIRKYETLGFLPNIKRRDNDYRDFSDDDVRRLQFIHRARELGFPLVQVKHLLTLWDDEERACTEVRALALAHAQDVDRKARQYREIADRMRRLADSCDGSGVGPCAILQTLEVGFAKALSSTSTSNLASG